MSIAKFLLKKSSEKSTKSNKEEHSIQKTKFERKIVNKIDWYKFKGGCYDGFNIFGYYNDELITYNMKYTLILNDINDNIMNDSKIAIKYNTLAHQIKRKRKKFNQLKYKPLVKNGRLRCQLCNNQTGFVFHHNHKTGELIAILCWGCNNLIGNNDLTPTPRLYEKKKNRKKTKIKRKNNPDFVSIKIEKVHPKTGKKFTQIIYKHPKEYYEKKKIDHEKKIKVLQKNNPTMNLWYNSEKY